MRTLTRALAVSCAAALSVPLWAGPSQAAPVSTTEAASSGAYFYSAGLAKPDASPQAPPPVTASADGVAPGNLAVAANANQNDKISFLFFSLNEVLPGSTITKAVLTVPLAPSDQDNVRIAAEPAKVRACKNGPEGFGGEDGAAMSLAPSLKCEEFSATAEASPDGSAYVIDITGLASTWADINDGVALVPNEGATTTPFQVVFQAADKATLAYEYEAPADLDTGLDSFDTSSDLSATSDLGTGSSDLGGFATDSGTASLDAGLGAVTAPLVGGALPEGPAPETADAPVATQRSAAEGPIEVLSLTPGFWLAAVLLAGGLAFLGLILGDPRSPALAAASASPSRLSRALARPGGAASLLASRSS